MNISEIETTLYSKGYKNVVGVDEAGRGPLAGPVVAAACCIPPGVVVPGAGDSKKLSASQRSAVFSYIRNDKRILYSVFINSAERIDQINVLQATLEAMNNAVDTLNLPSSYILVDGNKKPHWKYPSQAIIQGDSLCQCIAVASIIAKETRDRIMLELDGRFPGYGFKAHKGYGTKLHREAIAALGPCIEHRRSFAPLKNGQEHLRATGI